MPRWRSRWYSCQRRPRSCQRASPSSLVTAASRRQRAPVEMARRLARLCCSRLPAPRLLPARWQRHLRIRRSWPSTPSVRTSKRLSCRRWQRSRPSPPSPCQSQSPHQNQSHRPIRSQHQNQLACQRLDASSPIRNQRSPKTGPASLQRRRIQSALPTPRLARALFQATAMVSRQGLGRPVMARAVATARAVAMMVRPAPAITTGVSQPGSRVTSATPHKRDGYAKKAR